MKQRQWYKLNISEGCKKYFADKYGEENPEFELKGEDREVCGKSWMNMNGNPAALLYAMRTGFGGVSTGGKVYYGKIKGMGEFIHESELGEKININKEEK
jgi:hypothetical protein